MTRRRAHTTERASTGEEIFYARESQKRKEKRMRLGNKHKEKVKKKKTDENEKKERPEVLVGQFSSLGEEKTSSLVPGQFTASTLKSVTAIVKLMLMM